MLLIVGRIIRPHGIRGEVVAELRTDDPQDRFVPGTVFTTDPVARGPLTLEYARQHTTAGKARLLLALEEVNDRDTADSLRGVFLGVEVEDLPEIDDPDEFHDHQLVGLAVMVDGEKIGEVSRVIHGPAHDQLVVRRPGTHDALVPFVASIVPEVDVAGGKVVVTPPGGLFDL
ncbi:ribosome maturation factor RimM [Longispora fulva]|uniref:Ribosome maturation factor RimM n=1 Tax=Longispora fulva TaxID=619741 RepID=A0A8J7GPM7_9ACTN|nr:16S rRNA processing protein RimM [Longispora fulva]GIG60634.1 ribosome maturation factor RimM [Longispora fulva]